MSWREFRTWVIKKSTDPVAAKKLQDQFIQCGDGMLQSCHVDRCVQAWEVWMARMEASEELDCVYGTKAILA
eukprot:3484254-Rhodomonas_salina.1